MNNFLPGRQDPIVNESRICSGLWQFPLDFQQLAYGRQDLQQKSRRDRLALARVFRRPALPVSVAGYVGWLTSNQNCF